MPVLVALSARKGTAPADCAQSRTAIITRVKRTLPRLGSHFRIAGKNVCLLTENVGQGISKAICLRFIFYSPLKVCYPLSQFANVPTAIQLKHI